MMSNKNSASCFRLPRCLMTKVLRHPQPKSNQEGGQRQRRRSGPARPRASRPSSFVPCLLPCQPSWRPTKAHISKASGFFFCFPRALDSSKTAAQSGFFLVCQFKAAAAQTKAKFFHKLAPAADAEAWVYEEQGEQSTGNCGRSRVKGKILYF